MAAERRDPSEDPQVKLETALIDDFLRTRGTDRHSLRNLPEAQAIRLSREASAYATARLTEVESRAHYLREIHGTASTERADHSRR